MRRATLLVLSLCACRTEILPIVKTQGAEAVVRKRDEGCQVRDYALSTDLPDGAKNLGWVQVARETSDEAAYEALRAAICEKGGNAFSQPRWVREAGASVASAPSALEANAWVTP